MEKSHENKLKNYLEKKEETTQVTILGLKRAEMYSRTELTEKHRKVHTETMDYYKDALKKCGEKITSLEVC